MTTSPRWVKLCSIAATHAGDKLSKGWQLALSLVIWIRRWVFLPNLVITVPSLVMYKGGDSLSICLNTVAILVMCEIDNVAFVIALGEKVRSRVEEAGRVHLSDGEASALIWTKVVHVVLLVLAVTVAVLFQRPWFTVVLAFLLGGLVESFVQRVSVAETAMRVAKVLGAWLTGVFAIGWLSHIAGS
eukprot:COSAG06_NODE_10712_length_1630_cov_112.784455_1_plen_187_part_00